MFAYLSNFILAWLYLKQILSGLPLLWKENLK